MGQLVKHLFYKAQNTSKRRKQEEREPTVGEEQIAVAYQELEFHLGISNIHIGTHIHKQAGTYLSMSL